MLPMRLLFVFLIFGFFTVNAQDKSQYDFNWNVTDTIVYKSTVKKTFIDPENKSTVSETKYSAKLFPHNSNYIDVIVEKLTGDEEESLINKDKFSARINLKGEAMFKSKKSKVDPVFSAFDLPKNIIGINQIWKMKRKATEVNYLPDSFNLVNEVKLKEVILKNDKKIAVFEHKYLEEYETVFAGFSSSTSKYSISGYTYFSLDSGILLKQELIYEYTSVMKILKDEKEVKMSILTQVNTYIEN